MAQRARERSSDDGGTREELPPLSAREAADVAREYLTDVAGQEPVAMTSVEPAEDGGWVVELEVIEERRIPSSADILGLYQIDVDPDGELLGFRRVRRYMRGQTGSASDGGGPR
jgi:hypothetical protein